MKMKTMDISRVSSFKTVKRPVVKKRNEITGKSHGTSVNKRPKLTLETLQQLTPFQHDVDIVTQAARYVLVDCIRMHPSVHSVFFPDATKDSLITDEDMQGFPIEKLSVAMVAEAISKCNDKYKFCNTIERNNLESALKDVHKSVHWRKLGNVNLCLFNYNVVS